MARSCFWSRAAPRGARRIDSPRVCRGFLAGDIMVEAEDEQGIDIGQHPFVERQRESGLVDSLEYRHLMAGNLADQVLERNPGPEEQFQRTRDSLLELQWIGEARN